MATTHKCPICGKVKEVWPRYPRLVCSDCTARVTDKAGRPLAFADVESVTVSQSDVGEKSVKIKVGDVHGSYADTGTPYRSTICYIDGIRCRAEEAHFGGIVIQAEKRRTK